MEAYAIIKTGGKQYRVTQGEVLDIEKISSEEGDTVSFENVLAFSDGEQLSVDTETATVSAEVVKHLRAPKVTAFKKKRRKGYQRKVGHRQDLTRIKITGLTV